MATEKLPTIPHAQVPQFGRIVGGVLDGWSFGLTRVEVSGRSVHLVVNATPPNWPFPTPVRLNARKDFDQLQPGPGAAINDSTKLIAHAIDAEKYKWNE